MGRCRLANDDPHDWQFMFTLGNSKTLPQAVFGCHCSAMKKVAMRWDFAKLHPDERIEHMRRRAGVQEEGDEYS